MRIQSSSSDLISAWFGNVSFSETGEQRTDDHYGAAQASAFFAESIGTQIINVHIIGLESVFFVTALLHFYSEFTQQVDEFIHIDDVGDISDRDLFRSKKNSGDH